MLGIDEKLFVSTILPLWLFIGGCSMAGWLLLAGQRLIYGRYTTTTADSLKIHIPGWTMLLIVVAAPIGISVTTLLRASPSTPLENFIVVCLYCGHYCQRGLIYPFLIRGSKPTPMGIIITGVVFAIANGYTQSVYHIKYATYPAGYLWSLRGMLGLFVFLFGMVVNIHSDHILRCLRTTSSDMSYSIPRGGLFEYVSAANYFGEIVEWTGYAIFAASFAGWACLALISGNMIPRALDYHRWYLHKFEDYPKGRRAVIPFIL